MVNRKAIILWLLLLISSLQIYATSNQKSDSLVCIIEDDSNQANVLSALKALASMNRDKPEEVSYLKELLNNAHTSDSISYIYYALGNLSRYYYNKSEMDSLIYWSRQVDSLAVAKREYPDVYFDVHAFISKQHLFQNNAELSINEAVKMQNRAKQENQIYGQICSAETLGAIYQSTNRDSMSSVYFNEALDLLEQTNGDLYYRIYILSNMIRNYLQANALDQAEGALKKYEAYIDIRDGNNQKNHIADNTNWHRWMLYSFYTDFYLKKRQTANAKQALDKTIAFKKQIKNDVFNIAVFYYYYALIMYYKQAEMYSLALAAADSILIYNEEPKIIQEKIEILSALRQYEEATKLSKMLLLNTEQINNQTFVRQIEQLRTLHNVNDKELQDQELLISSIKVEQNQRKLVMSFVVLFILVTLLSILVVLIKKSQKLRDELEKEKHILINSQEELYEAKIKAETASLMKSTFIASISHEIRTPLNAIVGFSSLVADPSNSEEEQKGYASVISDNSDLLLNIINDVLDLSHMESGSLTLSIRPYNVYNCCKETMEVVKSRVNPNVKLTLTIPDESFILETDPLRLKQLLLNLLINAAKFTQEGEINLAVHIEKDQVKFEVTDTGCGIPLDKQEKVFGRFEKLNEYAQGAGLGLSICKMIAEHLHGSIFIDPSYTSGARFVFIHPLHINELSNKQE